MRETFKDVFDLVVPCDGSAPRRVRNELAMLPVGEGVREDARLVASELVSNAVIHSGCSAHDEIHVRARLSESLLEIRVRDAGRSSKAPEVRSRDEERVGGLGLVLVEELSQAWGVEKPDGHAVWAQLPLVSRATSPVATRLH